MKIYCFSKNKFKNLILSMFIYLRKKFKIKKKKNKNSKNNDKGLKYEYEDVDFVIGDCGSGKSVYLVSQAIKYLKMGCPVYSTTPISGCRILNINDLMIYDLEDNAVLIFDEGASMGLGARGDLAKKNSNSNVVEFFTMNRHYKVRKVVIASPSFADIIPIVRSRVRTVTVTKRPVFIQLLLSPINFFRKLFKKEPLKVTLLRFIGKTICLPSSDTMKKSSEPQETFYWLSALNRKYVLQNRYYKYFNSFSHKNLQKKRWEVW